MVAWVCASSLIFLALLGVVAARAGGAGVLASAWRVTFWGALAMALDGRLGRGDGALLMAGAVAYLGFLLWMALRNRF